MSMLSRTLMKLVKLMELLAARLLNTYKVTTSGQIMLYYEIFKNQKI